MHPPGGDVGFGRAHRGGAGPVLPQCPRGSPRVQALFRIAQCVSGITALQMAICHQMLRAPRYPLGMTDSDLDLRLVRYFTVVADHRHFGRAAEALRIAQPSLSRQIRRLEQELGARLLDRTPQGSRLTEAGEVFLPAARALLRSAARAAAATRAAAQPRRIAIGYPTGVIVPPAAPEWRRQPPDADVHTVHLEWNAARQSLLDHRVDAVVTRLPFPTDQ